MDSRAARGPHAGGRRTRRRGGRCVDSRRRCEAPFCFCQFVVNFGLVVPQHRSPRSSPEVPMRIPVLVALAVPVVLVSGAAAVYKYGRPVAGQVRTYYIAADEVPAEGVPGAADGTRYVKAR